MLGFRQTISASRAAGQPALEHFCSFMCLEFLSVRHFKRGCFDLESWRNYGLSRSTRGVSGCVRDDDRKVGQKDGPGEANPHKPALNKNTRDDANHTDRHRHKVANHARATLFFWRDVDVGDTLGFAQSVSFGVGPNYLILSQWLDLP